MLNRKVQIVVGFKDLHSCGKMKNIGKIKMNKKNWQQMIQNLKRKLNHLLQYLIGRYHWGFRKKNIQLVKVEKNHWIVIVL